VGPALLRAVLDEPWDDLHRLVYADWLEEHGQAGRAEFVRLQVELGCMPAVQFMSEAAVCLHQDPGVECHRCHQPRRRELELLDAGGNNWCDGLLGKDWWAEGAGKDGNTVHVGYTRVPRHTAYLALTFRRGFVNEVLLTCADFLEHAGALFSAAPVTRVTLVDKKAATWVHHDRYYFFEGDYGTAHLPITLYCLLDATDYPSQRAAENALSHACVSCGRAAAALYPGEVPT
jgi:uncharacterized protein (TIGR02996 family)